MKPWVRKLGVFQYSWHRLVQWFLGNWTAVICITG